MEQTQIKACNYCRHHRTVSSEGGEPEIKGVGEDCVCHGCVKAKNSALLQHLQY